MAENEEWMKNDGTFLVEGGDAFSFPQNDNNITQIDGNNQKVIHYFKLSF